jgi:hypothetical protein|tara:strand:+ start:146 stop:286 length:141 start_codon:yes stop_codon:yes gene_type:complete
MALHLASKQVMPIQEWKRKVARLEKEYCKENLTVGFPGRSPWEFYS